MPGSSSPKLAALNIPSKKDVQRAFVGFWIFVGSGFLCSSRT